MKALVLLDGDPPGRELMGKHADARLIVCADGAANWAAGNIRIDVLVGDMDSIGEKAGARDYKDIVRVPCEKDETDAQIAVMLCAQRGADQIVMLGATGKRLDHALGNVQLLVMLFGMGIEAFIEDEYNIVTVQSGSRRYLGEPGKLISIVPLGETVRATTAGLKYPLSDYRLALDKPLGISNVFESSEAGIVISEGFCVVVLPK